MNRLITIVNPASANGKTGREWGKIESSLKQKLGDKLEINFTKRPEDATHLARQALELGAETIIAVGGDGTVNEVVNGFFVDDRPINPKAAFAIISRGTGKDLIKTLGISSQLDEAVETIAARSIRAIDLGKVSFVGFDGAPRQRYFVNVADLGFSGEVAERVNKSSKALGGFMTFLLGMVVTLVTYKNKKIQIKIDEQVAEELKINSVNITNGQWFGGGMWIAPEAQIDDGLFDIVVVEAMGPLGVLANTPKLYNGTIKDHPKVRYFKGKRIVVQTKERVLLDTDGEQPGLLPATFEILPRVLNCIVPLTVASL